MAFFFLFKTIKYAYLCNRDLKLCKLEPTAVHQECTENGPRTTVVSGPTNGRAQSDYMHDGTLIFAYMWCAGKRNWNTNWFLIG